MKDTIDRPAAVRVLASVPAWKVPVVAMATPVDPILSAIERDRLAHVAFVTSVNRTNEGKTAQEARDVTQADEDAYEAASGVEEDAVSEPRDDGVWRSELGGGAPSRLFRRSAVRRRATAAALRTCYGLECSVISVIAAAIA